MTHTKEKALGERFHLCGKELVTVEFRGCRDCFLFDSEECSEYATITGSCMACNRTDGKTVCFMEVDKAKNLGLIENQ